MKYSKIYIKKFHTICLLILSTLCVNIHANTPIADIFYGMDQAPVTADAMVDATTNTTGTLSNTANDIPALTQGAAMHSLTAWDFSQTESYIRTTANATTAKIGDLNTTNGLTIGFWVNLNYDPSHANLRIAGIWDVFDIPINSNGITFRFDDVNSNAIASSTSDNIFNGTWQHVVATLDFTSTSNNLVMYLNGLPIETASFPITASFNNTTKDLFIGARLNGGNRFPGKLDDFIIFDEALSSQNVTKLFDEGAYNFIDPNTYQYAPRSQAGGYDYHWDDYSNDQTTGLGTRTVNFDYTGVNTISHVPPVGVHPRLYFGADEVPEIKNRLENTVSGQHIAAYIHAHTTLLNLGSSQFQQFSAYNLDPDGTRWVGNVGYYDYSSHYNRLIAQDTTVFDDANFNGRRGNVATTMSLEAFQCYLYAGEYDPDTGEYYDDRALDLITAFVFWAENTLTDPSADPNGGNYRRFNPMHMAITYDLMYNLMTETQRDITRRALVKVTPDRPRYGDGMLSYAITSNWIEASYFEIIGNLAIQGEPGYKPDLTREWMRGQYNFLTYAWNPSGAPFEGLGKNTMSAFSKPMLARYGYSLLGHPHMRNFGHNYLLGIMQPYGHGFTTYDTWGGSGRDPATGQYKIDGRDIIGLKYIFPNDPNVDFAWRNAIKTAYNYNSEGYIYQAIGFGGDYTNFIIPAALYAMDYDDSDFNTIAASTIQQDYLTPHRGLAVMRSGTDSLSLSTQFHCRQNIGGHTHGDRNDFTLSGLGRMWVRKTYASGNFEQSYYHSCILVNDLGVAPSSPDGKKCRQPAKILDYESGNNISTVTGDATYAYSYQWHWSAQDANTDHPWLGTSGWEKVSETWNDFLYEPKPEPYYDIPYYDFPHWQHAGKFERMIKREVNPMQRVIRSVAMVRGEHPFTLVVDDVQKDNNVHNYKWVAQIANDLVIESTSVNLQDCNYQNDIILKEPDATGNRRLLVRILHNEGYDGTTPNGYVEEIVYADMYGNSFNPNPNTYRQRLLVESNSVAPDFRVMLYPHYAGDELPLTEWNDTQDKLLVIFPGETQTIALNPQEGGKWNKIELENNNPLTSDCCIDIQLKASLEGAYDNNTNQMTTNLHSRGLLPGQTPASNLATPTPAGQPYQIAPWNYTGTEGTTWTDVDYTGNETDWILVSFRTGITKNTEVVQTAALLMQDGTIELVNRCALLSSISTPLYIVLEHRNHVGVMTPQPVEIVNGVLSYDFRTSDSYRDPTSFGQKQLPNGEWAMFAGDANQMDFPSFDVNGTDKTEWFNSNGVFDYYLSPDFNLDGDVNGQDKSLWFENNGISSRVPK